MKKIKLIIATTMIVALLLCTVGCAREFSPSGITVIENINGLKYEYPIEDKEVVKKLWKTIDAIECDPEVLGKQGSSYIYFYFYNKKQTEYVVCTIYDTGACCIGEDFKTFYALTNGVQLYLDLEEICVPFRKNAQILD